MRMLIIGVLLFLLVLIIISNIPVVIKSFKRNFNLENYRNMVKTFKKYLKMGKRKFKLLRSEGMIYRKLFKKIQNVFKLNTKNKWYGFILIICIFMLSLQLSGNILNLSSLLLAVLIIAKIFHDYMVKQDNETKLLIGVFYYGFIIIYMCLVFILLIKPERLNIYFVSFYLFVSLVSIIFTLNIVLSINRVSVMRELGVIIAIMYIMVVTVLSYYAIGVGFIGVRSDLPYNLEDVIHNVDILDEDLINQLFTVVFYGVQELKEPEKVEYFIRNTKHAKWISSQYIQFYLVSATFTSLYLASIIGFFTKIFTDSKN